MLVDLIFLIAKPFSTSPFKMNKEDDLGTLIFLAMTEAGCSFNSNRDR